MRKAVVFLAAVFFAFIGSPPLAKAHFLATDGTIGAVYHTDPDDNPVAGQPTSLFFDFKDTSGKFQFAGCRCVLSIKEDGKELLSQPLSRLDPSTGGLSFVFPKEGAYRIQLAGSPLQPGSFTPFALAWDQPIGREDAGNTAVPNWEKAVAALVLIGAALVFRNFRLPKNNAGKSKDGASELNDPPYRR